MVEKKILTEEELNISSDSQLIKASGNKRDRQICPVCKAGELKRNRYGSYECTLCPYVYDPNF